MKNKRIRRGVALIVSVLVGLQLFPMSALAAMMVTEEIATNVSASGNNAVPDIVAEVVEEREEFSKVYLLEDGSYYQITTCSPIHEEVNGEWENISNNLNEVLPQNTEEAESLLQQAVLSHTVSITRDIANATTYAIKATEEPITEEFYNCDEIMGGSHNFTEGSRILIKPNEVGNFLAENKTILEANIVIDCSIEPENSRIYVKQIDQPWENINNYNDISTYAGETVDCVGVFNDGTHKIDITELFSRWENATAENNGVVIYAEEECDFTIDIVSISVRFDEIDMVDVDYTYHTIKMGQAGTLYINDFTNTIRLEQEIIGTKDSVLPIFIKRFYNSVNATEKKPAGIGFIWNYCSKISFSESVVTWTLLDGSVRHFKSPNTSDLITNGEYKKWIESGTYVGDASLWLKTEEDYSTMYIELDGATYRFNSSGNLTKIEFSNREIIISYDSSDRIISVSEDDTILNFIYNSKNWKQSKCPFKEYQ